MNDNKGMSSDENQIFTVIASLTEQMEGPAAVINTPAKKTSKEKTGKGEGSSNNKSNAVMVNGLDTRNKKASKQNSDSSAEPKSSKKKTKKAANNPFGETMPYDEAEEQRKREAAEQAEVDEIRKLSEQNRKGSESEKTGSDTASPKMKTAESDSKSEPPEDSSTKIDSNASPEQLDREHTKKTPQETREQNSYEESEEPSEQEHESREMQTCENLGECDKQDDTAMKEIPEKTKTRKNEVSIPAGMAVGAPSSELIEKSKQLEKTLDKIKAKTDRIRAELDELDLDEKPSTKKKVPFRKIGTRISKEEAEQLKAQHESNEGGVKATLIIHTRTVDANGNSINDEMGMNVSKGTEDADSSGKKVSCEETSANEEVAPEENFEENISKQETSYSYPQIINTMTGEVYEITNSHFDIGKTNDMECTLQEHYISRRHALITTEKNTYYISDLGSTNGTFLNGSRLQRGERQKLSDGDIIKLADVEFKFFVG